MKNKYCKVVKNPRPANKSLNPNVTASKNPSPANRSLNTYPKVKGRS